MKAVLQRLVSSESGFSLSLRKGRCGWLFQSPLAKQVVRQRLGKWCTRVCVVHAPSGKFFAQPSSQYFGRALAEQESLKFLASVQKERLRRLRPFLGRTTTAISPYGGQAFRRIALRLDALEQSSSAEALCRHLRDDLDLLWREVPLFRVRLTRSQRLVLRTLSQ